MGEHKLPKPGRPAPDVAEVEAKRRRADAILADLQAKQFQGLAMWPMTNIECKATAALRILIGLGLVSQLEADNALHEVQLEVLEQWQRQASRSKIVVPAMPVPRELVKV